jgi:predicted deacylase
MAFASALLWAVTPVTAPAQAPELPVREIRGTLPGPTLALVAGVHGGKVSAVRALDAIAARLAGVEVRGTILLVGPANRAGFDAGLAQTSPSDGLNLNRVFPGNENGAHTERLAARIMREVVARSDFLVDMHGSDGLEAVGRFAYAANPGVNPAVDAAALRLAEFWGTPLVVWDDAGPRTLAESRFLQTAAHLSGVPAITVFEAGRARESAEAQQAFVRGALSVIENLGFVRRHAFAPFIPANGSRAEVVLPRRRVVTSTADGAWEARVAPGTRIAARDLLGTLTDSTGRVDSLRASARGIVLHQRLSGRISNGTALVILGVIPDSLTTTRAP